MAKTTLKHHFFKLNKLLIFNSKIMSTEDQAGQVPKMFHDTNSVEVIAEICHNANRNLCQKMGDNSQKVWRLAPDWQKESAVKGVLFHLNNPDSTPENSHESWLKEKEETGWKYGPVKDPEKKEHPCMVPYNELPVEQQLKGHLFHGIINALKQIV